MIDRQPLPTLQGAVDALHARLTSGRARATGTAVKTGLTGRITNLTPDELGILEDVMGGRWSAVLSETWSRDELDAAGASEEDWALEKEIAYWAIRRGLESETLALIVERIMRAGPYRSKWDEARGAVSWLAQDVANAIQTTQDRLKTYAEQHPDLPSGWANNGPSVDLEDGGFSPDDAPAVPETLEQKVIRLERENRQLRATNAVQMTVINSERAELEDKTAYISLVTEVLAKPNEEMSSTEKVVFLALTWETHYRSGRGRTKLPLIALVERTGMSKNTVSTASRALSDRPGSPFERRVTRELRRFDDGNEQFVTTIEFRPRAETVEQTIRAGIALPKAPDKAKHGGSEQAAARRWGRCDQHNNQEVRIKGYCPDCGRVVGEGIVTRKEFEVLNHQVCVSGAQASPVDVVTSTHNMRDSDGAGDLKHHDVDPALPLNLLDYAASRPQEPPKRCPAPGCGAMEFRTLIDGTWRCQRSGHDPSVYLLPAAVRGASE